MDYEPLTIIGIAIAIGIGNYSIFYFYMEKSFVKRYKAFKDAFDKWMEAEVTKFYDSLKTMLTKKAEPQELSDFVNEWGTRTADLLNIFETYKRISENVKRTLLLLVGSVLTSGLHLMNPDVLNPGAPKPFYWINIATLLLFLAILLIFYYIYSFHKISSKVTQFELGEPIEEIFEKERKKPSIL